MTSAYTGTVRCDRCGTVVDDAHAVGGCPTCDPGTVPVNLRAVFEPYDPLARRDDTQPGVFRWRAGLPIGTATRPVSLHEGGTPAVRADGIAERLGVASVTVKDETRNPTWSYKDRLAAVAVTRAKEVGARTVVVASTGNHGAAVAAYAAVAGLDCVVLTARSASQVMVEQMRAYGARVVALPTNPDRWTVMRAAVEDLGWFPVSGFQSPPVGSTPFGVEGYKSVAFELCEQLDAAPTHVLVPTSYGDGLAGVHRGFVELHAAGHLDRLPRMVAAESLGPYSRALRTPGADVVPPVERVSTLAFSAGTPVGTYQTLAALRASGGTAVGPIADDAILDAQRMLATETGVYPETSSAMTLAAALRLRDEGALTPTDRLVLLVTSTGLKSTAETAAHRPDIPVIEPTLAALSSVVRGVVRG